KRDAGAADSDDSVDSSDSGSSDSGSNDSSSNDSRSNEGGEHGKDAVAQNVNASEKVDTPSAPSEHGEDVA
ncbi:hypothetical protein, partial [Mesorhizobium sp.]